MAPVTRLGGTLATGRSLSLFCLSPKDASLIGAGKKVTKKGPRKPMYSLVFGTGPDGTAVLLCEEQEYLHEHPLCGSMIGSRLSEF